MSLDSSNRYHYWVNSGTIIHVPLLWTNEPEGGRISSFTPSLNVYNCFALIYVISLIHSCISMCMSPVEMVNNSYTHKSIRSNALITVGLSFMLRGVLCHFSNVSWQQWQARRLWRRSWRIWGEKRSCRENTSVNRQHDVWHGTLQGTPVLVNSSNFITLCVSSA